MRRVAALLAAVLALTAAAGCGSDGAEPGAPDGATLLLDFTPNAAHSGLYLAAERGLDRERGVELSIREPGEGASGAALLDAGRAQFAVLDIHDLGIAREHGLDVVAIAPLVNAPLASIIARRDGPVRRPADLAGRTVGVTGLPSDEAVVDSALAADEGDPAAARRVTIGFNAVASLAAGRVAAVTAFWNAEAITLRRRGVPVRVFAIDDYGAPPYPELVLATARRTLEEQPDLVDAVTAAARAGYASAVADPDAAIEALAAAVPGLDRPAQEAQLAALLPHLRPRPFDPATLRAWADWDLAHGILRRRLDVDAAFDLGR